MKHKYDNDLINKAQGIARCLTYNDDKPQAEAKHMLLELSRRLGSKCTRVTKERGKLAVSSLYGRWRYLTFKERVLYRIFNIIPSVEVCDGCEVCN